MCSGRSIRWALAVVMFVGLGAGAQDLKEDIESYFEGLRKSFSQIAGSAAVKKTRISTTDRFFVRSLKKHQTIYSLIRTNSKGIVISEVIRGKPPEREYRNIARQKWFQYVARNNKLYDGFLKEEGRYYLFWAEPVIHTARSRKKSFIGAAAAKVDLWDCFHKLSSTARTPFLVRVNGKSLYSHKWQRGMEFREERLDIPGVDRITLRYVEGQFRLAGSDTAAFAPQSRTQAETAPATGAKTEEVTTPKLRMKSYTIVIIIGAVMLLALVVAIVRLLIWVRYHRLTGKIDKESIL